METSPGKVNDAGSSPVLLTFYPRPDGRPATVMVGKLPDVDIRARMAAGEETACVKEAINNTEALLVVDVVWRRTEVIGKKSGRSRQIYDRRRT